jgi:hypothetical protein
VSDLADVLGVYMRKANEPVVAYGGFRDDSIPRGAQRLRRRIRQAPERNQPTTVGGEFKVRTGDEAEVRRVAGIYESKYGAQFTEPDGIWFGIADAIRGGQALAYRVAPTRSFGYGKGKQLSQTRWRFSDSRTCQDR